MSTLINMILRVAMWGALGAIIAVVLMLVAQNFFEGGVLGSGQDSGRVVMAGMVGAAAGAIFGFFKKR